MSARQAYLLDANVLLRFLLNDDKVEAAAALKLFDSAGAGRAVLHIPLVAIYETVIQLESYHKIDRHDIGREMLKILNAPGVKLTCPGWMLEAVEDYRTRSVSFSQACLAAEAYASKLARISS